MQSVAIIRLVGGRLAWYPPGAGEEPAWLDAAAAREALRATLAQRGARACFAAPAADLRLVTLAVDPQERRHLAGSLSFMLEDQVAQDIEQLHFAAAPLDRAHYGVGLCTVRKMTEWQALLADFPGLRRWVPEPLLLPWQRGQWCLVSEGGAVLVRTGECAGFGIERATAPVLLAAALREGPAPQAVIVYGDDQAADTALLPEPLRTLVQWRRGNFCTAMLLTGDAGVPLNLLQGRFMPRLPLARWWRQWRAVAAVLGVTFALQLLATYADYRRLSSENRELREAVQESYRSAYPSGAIVDAEKQLRRQLDALRGAAQSSGFVSLMARVGAAVAARPGTAISSINYNDQRGEIRMHILAADFEAVEQVRAAMSQAGLQAAMERSSAREEQVSARLRVGERS